MDGGEFDGDFSDVDFEDEDFVDGGFELLMMVILTILTMTI